MKNFKHYLAESEKKNFFAIKFNMHPDELQSAIVKNVLQKYGVVDMGKAEPVLDDKIDFYDAKNKDIWQISFVSTMPVSTYVLQQEVKSALGIAEEDVVVRSSNEPIQQYVDQEEFDYVTKGMADKEGLEPAARLSTDRLYNPEEDAILTDLFGNEYNKRLLDYLADIKANRPTQEYEPSAPLFSWIDMHKAVDSDKVIDEDFNKDFDTPKPVMKGSKKQPVDPINLGNEGQLDDMAIQNVKLMKTKTGKRKNFLAPRAGLKAEKER